MREKNPLRNFHLPSVSRTYSAAAALAMIVAACPLLAQFSVKQVNLAYLSQRADVIVQGRITNVIRKPLRGHPNVRTIEVTLDVERSLRGVEGKTYAFREILLGLRSKEGKRAYRVGQRLFLFLPLPSQYGLSSPIGIGQGRFHIDEDSTGNARLANEHANAGLFRNVERDAGRDGKQLTAGHRKLAATTRGPVRLEEFVSLVKTLMTLPRIR